MDNFYEQLNYPLNKLLNYFFSPLLSLEMLKNIGKKINKIQNRSY